MQNDFRVRQTRDDSALYSDAASSLSSAERRAVRAARLQAEQEQAAQRRKFLVIAIVAVAFILAVVLMATGAFGCSKDASDQGVSAESAQNVEGEQADFAASAGNSEVSQASMQVASYARYRTPEERSRTSASTNETLPGEHVCYLTFDDGPSTNTQRILDILDQYGVKATWFVKADSDQLARVSDIWNAGHQVAIHTFNHEYEIIYASTDAFWADYRQAGSAIAGYLGFTPTLFRFPGGSVNSYNANISGELANQAHSQGLHFFDWNVSCGDGADHTADDLVYYTTAEADGNNSSCVLMHDSAAKDTTVEALPRIIEWFINDGYTFDVLTCDSFGYHF